jgi:hypothetical protein
MKTTSSLAPIPWLVCLLAASAPAPAGRDLTAITVDSSIDTNSVTVVLNLYGDPSLDRRGIDLPLDPR